MSTNESNEPKVSLEEIFRAKVKKQKEAAAAEKRAGLNLTVILGPNVENPGTTRPSGLSRNRHNPDPFKK